MIYTLFLIVIAMSVIIDQATKYFADGLNALPGGTLPLIDSVFHLTYATNDGAAFSIFRGRQVFLITVTAVMLVAVAVYFIMNRKNMGRFETFALGLFTGGAIGNFIDRVRFGYVVDFLDFRLINFAVFNFADMCINVGTALLCFYILIWVPLKRRREAAGEVGDGGA